MSIRWASVLLPVCIARAKNESNSSQNRKRDTCVHSFSFSVGFCSLGNRANGSTCAKLSSVRMHTHTQHLSCHHGFGSCGLSGHTVSTDFLVWCYRGSTSPYCYQGSYVLGVWVYRGAMLGGCGWSESKKVHTVSTDFLGFVLKPPKVHTAIKDL